MKGVNNLLNHSRVFEYVRPQIPLSYLVIDTNEHYAIPGEYTRIPRER